MPEFEIISLSPADWQRYRDIRLEALQTEPGAFATSYAAASQRPPESWQERLTEAAAGEKSWLLFAQAGVLPATRVIGLVGAFLAEEGTSAEIVQVYVTPDWRGKGVGRRCWNRSWICFARKASPARRRRLASDFHA